MIRKDWWSDFLRTSVYCASRYVHIYKQNVWLVSLLSPIILLTVSLCCSFVLHFVVCFLQGAIYHGCEMKNITEGKSIRMKPLLSSHADWRWWGDNAATVKIGCSSPTHWNRRGYKRSNRALMEGVLKDTFSHHFLPSLLLRCAHKLLLYDKNSCAC